MVSHRSPAILCDAIGLLKYWSKRVSSFHVQTKSSLSNSRKPLKKASLSCSLTQERKPVKYPYSFVHLAILASLSLRYAVLASFDRQELGMQILKLF